MSKPMYSDEELSDRRSIQAHHRQQSMPAHVGWRPEPSYVEKRHYARLDERERRVLARLGFERPEGVQVDQWVIIEALLDRIECWRTDERSGYRKSTEMGARSVDTVQPRRVGPFPSDEGGWHCPGLPDRRGIE